MALDARRARVSLRQLVLFVLSMVVPSIVLVALGVRIIVQQEELTYKHVADQTRLRASEFERGLTMRLDRVRLVPDDSSVALVATFADGRLVLPWETPSRITLAGDGPFNTRIARAEREEFAGRLKASLAELETALESATSDGQRAYARLLRARVFAKAQRPMEAGADYRALLPVVRSYSFRKAGVTRHSSSKTHWRPCAPRRPRADRASIGEGHVYRWCGETLRDRPRNRARSIIVVGRAKCHESLQQALSKERAEGTLLEAIALYQRVVDVAATDHALAAKALLQLGRCYETLGNAEARSAWPTDQRAAVMSQSADHHCEP